MLLLLLLPPVIPLLVPLVFATASNFFVAGTAAGASYSFAAGDVGDGCDDAAAVTADAVTTISVSAAAVTTAAVSAAVASSAAAAPDFANDAADDAAVASSAAAAFATVGAAVASSAVVSDSVVSAGGAANSAHAVKNVFWPCGLTQILQCTISDAHAGIVGIVGIPLIHPRRFRFRYRQWWWNNCAGDCAVAPAAAHDAVAAAQGAVAVCVCGCGCGECG